jgi:hypothetical protein
VQLLEQRLVRVDLARQAVRGDAWSMACSRWAAMPAFGVAPKCSLQLP